jgi:hypothetical protein
MLHIMISKHDAWHRGVFFLDLRQVKKAWENNYATLWEVVILALAHA